MVGMTGGPEGWLPWAPLPLRLIVMGAPSRLPSCAQGDFCVHPGRQLWQIDAKTG